MGKRSWRGNGDRKGEERGNGEGAGQSDEKRGLMRRCNGTAFFALRGEAQRGESRIIYRHEDEKRECTKTIDPLRIACEQGEEGVGEVMSEY